MCGVSEEARGRACLGAGQEHAPLSIFQCIQVTPLLPPSRSSRTTSPSPPLSFQHRGVRAVCWVRGLRRQGRGGAGEADGARRGGGDSA
eukprot:2636300-Rhodomonas_salina.1